MSDGANRNGDGNQIIQVSSKPYGTSTFFIGAGDCEQGYICNGDSLIFELSAVDSSKSVIISFTEDVYIKESLIDAIDAPFGAYLKADVINKTTESTLKCFANKIHLNKSNQYNLISEDKDILTPAMALKVTVYNAETKADFKVTGLLKIFRHTTIS